MDEKSKNLLVNYINSQKLKGVRDEAIKGALADAGWNTDDISVGFTESDQRREEGVPQVNEKTGLDSQQNQPDSSQDQSNSSELNSEGSKHNLSVSLGAPGEVSVDAQKLQSQEGGQSSNVVSSQTEKNASGQSVAVGYSDHSEQGAGAGLIKYILISVIVLLVLGSASTAAYFLLSREPAERGDADVAKESGDALSYEKIIVDSLLSYADKNLFSNSIEIRFSLNDEIDLDAVAEGYFRAGEDVHDVSMLLGFNINALVKEEGVSMDVSVDGELRSIEGDIYIYFETLNLPFMDWSFLQERWFHIALEEILPIGEPDSALDLNESLIGLVKNDGVTVLDVAQEEGFIEITPLEDGLESYTFEIEFYVENMPRFLRALNEELSLGEYGEVLREEANNVEDYLDESKEMGIDAPVIPFTLNIDETGHLKRVSVEINSLDFIDWGEVSSMDLYIHNSFDDISETFEFEAPDEEEVEPFENAVDEVFGSMFGGDYGDLEMSF